MKSKGCAAALCAALLCAVGCASLPESSAEMTETESTFIPDLSEAYGNDAGVEGFNRAMYEVNRLALRYGVMPLGCVWTSIFPTWACDRIYNIFHNLEFPVRMFSCFCENKWGSGGMVFARFLTNTTLGIAGMFDVAHMWFGWEPREENFEQAFASWGIGRGHHLHLPLIGPTNIRDGVGLIFDAAFDPKSYSPVPGIGAAAGLNRMVRNYRTFDILDREYYDPYELAKRFYAIQSRITELDKDRYGEIEKDVLRYYFPDSAHLEAYAFPNRLPRASGDLDHFDKQEKAQDTVKSALAEIPHDNQSMWNDISLWNTDFFYSGTIRKTDILPGRDPLKYRLYLQDNADAPLAVVLPGTGGGYTSSIATGVGAVAYEAGYSVLILPNTFNWAFYKAACTAPLPGVLNSDVADIRNALSLIFAELTEDGYTFPSRVLLGISMGGMQTLAIAATEKNPEQNAANVTFDHYIALSPAVNLYTSALRIDALNRAFYAWNEAERFDCAADVLARFLRAKLLTRAAENVVRKVRMEHNMDALPPPPMLIPLKEKEAEALVGYAFTLSLHDLLMCGMEMRGIQLPNMSTDSACSERYAQMSRVNLAVYMDRILPYVYAESPEMPGIENFTEAADLNHYRARLKNNPRIHVFHAENDIISGPEDLAFLRDVFQDRLTLYTAGSHLGYTVDPRYLRDLTACLTAPQKPGSEKTESAAERNASNAASSCANETNTASNCEGGK